MAGVPWTEQEESMLKKLIETGCTPKDISQVFIGRTYAGICNKLQSMRLFCKPPTPDIDMDAYRLLTGEPADEI